MAVAAMTLVLVAAAVTALMLVLSPSSPATTVPAPAMAVASSSGPDETQEEEEEEEEEGQHGSPGSAVPLRISQDIRDALSAAARAAGAAPDAMNVATSGTIYYGIIYGETEATDAFYVVAHLQQVHFWTRQGRGPWKYEGGYDARVCMPSVPVQMYAAWGLSFSTPGSPVACSATAPTR
jgi:hypothetical protein